MKLFIALAVLAAIAATTEGDPGLRDKVKSTFRFGKEAVQGAGDMVRSYRDMRKANWRNSDKYFHARGNYNAARRGPGGAWAARGISNARERLDRLRGGSAADSAADQKANRWGRNGGDPNKYRPRGLPSRW